MIPADRRDPAKSPQTEEAFSRRARLVRNRRQRERYGPKHKRRRRQWEARLRRGEVVECPRCGLPVGDDQPWDLDHSDVDLDLETPAHRWCNRGAHRLKTSRDW